MLSGTDFRAIFDFQGCPQGNARRTHPARGQLNQIRLVAVALSLSTTLESEANLTGEYGATGFGSSLPVLGF
jgi:hypothetical protein